MVRVLKYKAYEEVGASLKLARLVEGRQKGKDPFLHGLCQVWGQAQGHKTHSALARGPLEKPFVPT